MRYLIYIVFIILLATAAIVGYDQIRTPAPRGEKALSVNERVITVDELRERTNRTPYAALNPEGFLEDLVTRQILIQEAMKGGIDREESFRVAIQEYFEQSLVKTLVDRKMAGLKPSVPEALLETSLRNSGLHFDLSLFRFKSENDARGSALDNPEKVSSAFMDLPVPLRTAVTGLEIGQTSPVLAGGGSFFRVRIDVIRPLAEGAEGGWSRSTLNQFLEKEMQQQAFDQWLSDLRTRAKVEITEAARSAGRKK